MGSATEPCCERDSDANAGCKTLKTADGYKLLQPCVPGHRLGVTSMNAEGAINLAPFSFFNGVGTQSALRRRERWRRWRWRAKHTAQKSFRARFVANLVQRNC